MKRKIIITFFIILFCLYCLYCYYKLIPYRKGVYLETNISKNYLSDKYNIDEIQLLYDNDENYWNKKLWNIPWGINKLETMRLVEFAEWKLINETNDSLIYLRTYSKQLYSNRHIDDTVTFLFNKNEQLYSIIEGFKNGPKFNVVGDPYTYFKRFEAFKLELDGYYRFLKSIEDIKHFGYELYWTDKLGVIHFKTIDTDTVSRRELFDAMNVNEINENIDLTDFVIENNLILKKIDLFNSTSIYHIVRKDDEKSCILEFILTNNKLLD